MAEFKASSVEEATRVGLEELGLSEDQAVVTVLDNGGFLKKAKVSVEPKPKETDVVLAFVKRMGGFLDANCDYSVTENDERITVLISGEEAGKLIGYRGDVLDAIQYIASVILNREHKDYKRVTIDCENYREKREEILKKLASRLAEKAVRTQKKVKLEPMNPAERRVIHSTLQENAEVETVSVGTEPNRYLTIVPKNMKKERKGRGDRPFRSGQGGGFNRDRNAIRPEGTSSEPREGGTSERTGERREFADRKPREFNQGGQSGGFNRDRSPNPNREGGSFNRDSRNAEGGTFNRDRRDGQSGGGFNRDRDSRIGDRRDGQSGGSSEPAPKKSFLGFGSYLGNTKSSLEREILEKKKQAFRDNVYVEPAEEPEETTASENKTEE